MRDGADVPHNRSNCSPLNHFSRVYIITTTGSILQNRTHVSWKEGGKGSAGRNDESRMEQD
jgi:hypothetical protein